MKEEIVLQREEGETGKRAWEEKKWKELGARGTEGKIGFPTETTTSGIAGPS